MNRTCLAALTLSLAGIETGCVIDDASVETSAQALASVNKVSLNKVSLNKVSLNKVSLNAVGLTGATAVAGYLELPTTSLTTAIDDPLSVVTATPMAGGYLVSFDGATTFLEIDAAALSDLVEKSARCINPPGTKTRYLTSDFDGQFGLGTRGLTPEQFVESYLSCLAIFANDQSAMINVTADLPGPIDVKATPEEFAVYRVPDVAVAYRVTSTPSGTNTRFSGNWYWNLSRNTDWSASAVNLWSWQAAKGRRPLPIEAERTCLEALRARQPMPAVCGGEESKVWSGVVTPGLIVPPGASSTLLCGGRLQPRAMPPARGTFEYNDYSKGIGCGATAPNGEMSAVFYAELPVGASFVEVNWARVEGEFAPPPAPSIDAAIAPSPGFDAAGPDGASPHFDAAASLQYDGASLQYDAATPYVGPDGGSY